MKDDHYIVQSPATPAQQLILLFHGVGDNPVAMGEIGRWFAPLFPQALVVSIGGPNASGPHPGREWFSVANVTEDNRQQRVDDIMPEFIERVRDWQKYSGVTPAATALVGFSQGAIMALESLKAAPGLAGRIVSFNGRFASLPAHAYTATAVHLIHGEDDPVIPLVHAVNAQEALAAGGGDVTLDIVEELGHAIDQRSMQFALDHLRYTVPKHYFDEALGGGAKPGDDIISLM